MPVHMYLLFLEKSSIFLLQSGCFLGLLPSSSPEISLFHLGISWASRVQFSFSDLHVSWWTHCFCCILFCMNTYIPVFSWETCWVKFFWNCVYVKKKSIFCLYNGIIWGHRFQCCYWRADDIQSPDPFYASHLLSFLLWRL